MKGRKVAGASSSRAETREQDAPATISKPALTPKLRFPEFRDDPAWSLRLLGQLCSIRTGKKDANEGADDGQYPFFTCAENHIYSHSYSFDAEAILVAGNANVGQTRYYRGKFEAYQRTYVLTDFSGVHVPYLFSFLSSNLRPSLLSQVQTSAMSYIKLPMLTEYELPVPASLAEQQKIAECLSTLDELIGAESQKLDTLKAHKKGLMQQLFPRVAGASSSSSGDREQDAPATVEILPRLRFPEFHSAPEWEEMRLADACVRIMDGTHFSPKTKEGPRPYLTSKNIQEGRLNLSNVSYISEDEHQQIYARCPVTLNDVLLTKDGANTGNCAINTLEYEFSLLSSVAVLRGKADKISQLFLFFTLLSDRTQTRITESMSGQAITRVTLEKIGNFQVALTSLAEQHRIATCLSSLDELIAAQSDRLSALQTHKQGLLQQLFPSPADVRA